MNFQRTSKHGMKRKNAKHKVIIRYQPLVGKKRIKLEKPIKKEILWDREILPKIKIGDWVSFHWGQAVEILTAKEVSNLEQYTKLTLSLIRY